MVKKITVFTTDTCAYCVMVKRYLGMKGQEYEEVNLNQDPARQQEAFELSGSLTTPITVVEKVDDSKQVVIGYNLAQLAPALS